MTSGIVRVKSAAQKFVNAVLWKALSVRLPPPQVDLVHDTNGKLFRLNEPGFIEPSCGYVITRKGVLIEDSMLTNVAYDKRPLRLAVPSLPDFRTALRTPSSCIAVETTVSTRHFWEWNYYHFFLDVLGFLQLVDTAGFLKKGRSLSAAKYLDDTKFGRQVIEQPGFAAYRWLAPGKEFVAAQTIYYGQTKTVYKDRIQYINQQMQLPASAGYEKRVFLTRGRNRRIANMEQIKPVLARHRFEIIDVEGMTIAEQATLFSQTGYLVTVHGAGTTNIIFRGGNKLNVLELHSDRYMNFDHKQIAVELGYFWDALAGAADSNQPPNLADFHIVPERLDEKITSLLAT